MTGKKCAECENKHQNVSTTCTECLGNYQNYPNCNECNVNFYSPPDCIGKHWKILLKRNLAFSSTLCFFTTECACNPAGSADLQCDENGDCPCKAGFGKNVTEDGLIIGGKCDACLPNYFGYPNCRGKFSKVGIPTQIE